MTGLPKSDYIFHGNNTYNRASSVTDPELFCYDSNRVARPRTTFGYKINMKIVNAGVRMRRIVIRL